MRIAVVCNDTRGGVQPYASLALGLRQAGHCVRAVAPASLARLFTDVGVPVVSLTNDGDAQRQATGIAEQGTMAAMRLMMREMPGRLEVSTRETLAACEGVELVTGGVGGMVIGLSVAEKLGVPFIETHLQPIGAPAREYPGVLLAGTPAWAGGWGRQLSHHLSDRALWMMFRRPMAKARERILGLRGRPCAADGQPVLYGFSRHVVPVPKGDGRRHVTGYWTLSAGPAWAPPPDLSAFLARGGPVVSVGFGSMAATDPKALSAMVRDAARAAGVRLVLLAGWSRFNVVAADEDVFCAEAVPHDWLFPRMSAVVHHGGAGTTGAALGAGVPSLVVPFGVDQPFWGGRVAALGAGPAPIPRRQLTRERLTGALRRMGTDRPMQAKAAAVGELIRAEDGVGNAVAQFARIGAATRRS